LKNMKKNVEDNVTEYQRAFNTVRFLQEAGYEALIVGGFVRDRILGIESDDVDVVTSAKTHEILELFPDAEVGLGTNFLVNLIDGVEVSTYRFDQIDEDGETTVLFAECFKDDSERRDLTVNAIGYDPIANKYIDHWGGIKDLKNGIIRFVDTAQLRIEEDPARILRAARFAAKTGFRLIPSAFFAIKDNAHLIKTIPAERIQKEILKAMETPKPSTFWNILQRTGVLAHIIPELDDCWYFSGGNHHSEYVHEHLMDVGDAIDTSNPIVRLAGYLHDIGKVEAYDERTFKFIGHENFGADISRDILNRLRFKNDVIDQISSMIHVHMRQVEVDTTNRGIRRTLVKLEKHNVSVSDFLVLKVADRKGNRRRTEYTPEEINIFIDKFQSAFEVENAAFSVKDLAINGNDVIGSGIPHGKAIGAILQYYFELVVEDPSANDRSYLLDCLNRVDDWNEYK